MKPIVPLIALSLTLGPVLAPIATEAKPLPKQTLVRDRTALKRLLGSAGITLQWIGWDRRGTLTADYSGKLLRLRGGQSAAPPMRGTLTIDGVVTEIRATSFTFVGRIDISDTPDAGRSCHRDGEMRFAITQNRKYWRLQQMEACDGLTDYVDIYF